MPRCMAALASQVKKITCQMLNWDCPSLAAPVQMLSLATSQKFDAPGVIPSFGRTAMAPVTKIRNIQGAATLANLASASNPRMAMVVITVPTPNTVSTHPMLLGNRSCNEGI